MYFFLRTEYKTLPFFHLPLITYSESFIYLMSLSVVQCNSQKILSSFFLYLPYKNIHNHTLRQHKQESDSHEQEREGGERKKGKEKRQKGKGKGKWKRDDDKMTDKEKELEANLVNGEEDLTEETKGQETHYSSIII